MRSGGIPDRDESPRQKARRLSRRFYVGDPCAEDHDGVRYTSTANCVDCQRAARKKQLDAVKAAKRNV